MLHLFFGWRGGMSRLQFFIVTILGVFFPLIVAAALIASIIGVQAGSETAAKFMADNGSLAVLAFGAIILVLLSIIWFQLMAMIKRSRTVGFGSWFRWAIVASTVVLPMVPVVNVLAWLFTAISWWVLLLKSDSLDYARIDDVDAFGERPSFADADLVARAAQLNRTEHRAPAVATAARSTHRSQAGAAPRGFGRRTQPAFGKR